MRSSRVSPQLSVKDVKATQEYYRDVLGFKVLWLWGKNDFGAVGANDVAIYFAHEDDPEGARTAASADCFFVLGISRLFSGSEGPSKCPLA